MLLVLRTFTDYSQACKTMKRFTPNDFVTMSIKFTKVLYAQIRSQEFDPPTGSGFKLPLKVPTGPQSPEWINEDVGMKIACGFEMLLAPEGVRAVITPWPFHLVYCG